MNRDHLVCPVKLDRREREDHEGSQEHKEHAEISDLKVLQEQEETTEILVYPDRPVFLVQQVHLEIL